MAIQQAAEKRDQILRRMLKTPPTPNKKPKNKTDLQNRRLRQRAK